MGSTEAAQKQLQRSVRPGEVGVRPGLRFFSSVVAAALI
jgi:hypothetical protein